MADGAGGGGLLRRADPERRRHGDSAIEQLGVRFPNRAANRPHRPGLHGHGDDAQQRCDPLDAGRTVPTPHGKSGGQFDLDDQSRRAHRSRFARRINHLHRPVGGTRQPRFLPSAMGHGQRSHGGLRAVDPHPRHQCGHALAGGKRRGVHQPECSDLDESRADLHRLRHHGQRGHGRVDHRPAFPAWLAASGEQPDVGHQPRRSAGQYSGGCQRHV